VYGNTPDRPKAETPAASTHNDCTTPVRAPAPQSASDRWLWR